MLSKVAVASKSPADNYLGSPCNGFECHCKPTEQQTCCCIPAKKSLLPHKKRLRKGLLPLVSVSNGEGPASFEVAALASLALAAVTMLAEVAAAAETTRLWTP